MAYPALATTTSPGAALARPLKRAIAGQIVALFNDRARGERPVARRPDGLFGPGSVAWRVHGDVTSMMVGGIAGLMLQMLYPAVLAGVWDHSRFRDDLPGRLRRTARFIALTTYGSREEAEAVIDRVRRIHGHVRGTLPDGTPYAANDPELLAWVHVAEATTFLEAWIRYAEPDMPGPDRDRYFAEMARGRRGARRRSGAAQPGGGTGGPACDAAEAAGGRPHPGGRPAPADPPGGDHLAGAAAATDPAGRAGPAAGLGAADAWAAAAARPAAAAGRDARRGADHPLGFS